MSKESNIEKRIDEPIWKILYDIEEKTITRKKGREKLKTLFKSECSSLLTEILEKIGGDIVVRNDTTYGEQEERQRIREIITTLTSKDK